MRNYQLEAIILRRYNIAEADRLLIMISPQLGKHIVKVRGVRKGSSKLAGHLELFCKVDLSLAKGHQFDVVTGAKTRQIYQFDRSDIERVALAYLFLEVIDKLTKEHLPNHDLYNLLAQALTSLSGGVDIALLRHCFLIKALKAIGQEPYLDDVGVGPRYYLSMGEGRVGHKSSGDAIEINPDTIKLWRYIYHSRLDQVMKIQGTNSIIAKSQELIENFYDYHLNLRFSSESILVR